MYYNDNNISRMHRHGISAIDYAVIDEAVWNIHVQYMWVRRWTWRDEAFICIILYAAQKSLSIWNVTIKMSLCKITSQIHNKSLCKYALTCTNAPV